MRIHVVEDQMAAVRSLLRVVHHSTIRVEGRSSNKFVGFMTPCCTRSRARRDVKNNAMFGPLLSARTARACLTSELPCTGDALVRALIAPARIAGLRLAVCRLMVRLPRVRLRCAIDGSTRGWFRLGAVYCGPDVSLSPARPSFEVAEHPVYVRLSRTELANNRSAVEERMISTVWLGCLRQRSGCLGRGTGLIWLASVTRRWLILAVSIAPDWLTMAEAHPWILLALPCGTDVGVLLRCFDQSARAGLGNPSEVTSV